MEMLTEALQQLREERTQAQEQVTKLDQAIVAIESIVERRTRDTRAVDTATNGECLPLRVGRSRRVRERDGAGQEPEACLGYG